MHYWEKRLGFRVRYTYEIVHAFIRTKKKNTSGKAEYIKNHSQTHIQKNQNLFYTFNVNVRKYLISYV